MDKNSYYFAISAALGAAAVMGPKAAYAVCDCTLSDLGLSGYRIHTQGAGTFTRPNTGGVNSVLGYTAGYVAELEVDNLWGFIGPTAPGVWIEFDPVSRTSATTHKTEVCARDWQGTSIICGTEDSYSVPANSTTHVERELSVAGLYTSENNLWNIYSIRTVITTAGTDGVINNIRIAMSNPNPSCWA
jgi:hypothetical protein